MKNDDFKQRLMQEIRNKLASLIEFGTEQDIIDFAKVWNPAIKDEQLKRVVKLFLAAKRERGHSQ